MLRSSLLFLVVFLSSGRMSGQGIDSTVTDSAVLLSQSCGPRQGYWKIYGKMARLPAYAPDAVVEEGRYVNGKKEGTWTGYYPNGQLQSRINFVNNRPSGEVFLYYEDGQLREQGTWRGNRWVDSYKLYYPNGNLRQCFFFNPTGQRHGTQYYYYADGSLQMELRMEYGKEEGWQWRYADSACLSAELFYHAGRLNEAKSRYYSCPNKQLPDEAKVRDTLPHHPISDHGTTPYRTLYKDGRVVKKGEFVNWKLKNGEERIYDDKGLLIQIKLYRDFKYAGDAPLPD